MCASLKHILFLTLFISLSSYAEETLTNSTNSLISPFPLSRAHSSFQELSSESYSGEALREESLDKKLNKIRKNLIQKAKDGDMAAQVTLIEAYQENKYGFAITRANQKIILMLLTEFAQHNAQLRSTLIRAYKDGEFGINYIHKKMAKIGYTMALDYISSPEVRNVIIEAMREERLTFASHHNHLKLIRELAFDFNNKNAQVFLLESYMNGKYGADFFDKELFRQVVKELERYAETNPVLADLIVLTWQQNLLDVKDKKALRKEQLRVSQHFKGTLSQQRQKKNFFLWNAFGA